MLKTIRTYGQRLAQPSTVFYTLIWLMILLVVGTIAQKYIGLYRAQEMFFFSTILWLGPVPLPGGLTTMAFFTLSLLAKMLFASLWTPQKAGSLITHLGALLLLGGSLLTFIHAQEGNMVIAEGEQANYFSDYHQRELVIENQDTGAKIAAFAWESLDKGKPLSSPDIPSLKIEIVKKCKNCAIFPRQDAEDSPIRNALRGMAQRMDIAPQPLEKEDELNSSAIQFRLSGASPEKNGIHFSADFIDKSPWVEIDNKTYNIALRKARTYLPFSIQLLDFEKQVHPGTRTARSYQSEIILIDGESEWRSLIRMNEPMRYKGYTFYQSSFIERGGEEATVLAVVKNAGRMFPYIASIVMCIGLLIHMAIALPRLISKIKRKVKAKTLPAILFALALLGANPAQAQDIPLDYKYFSQIPVLHEGRIKPLDTFARSNLEIFYGKDALPDMSAIQWLAEMMFTPARGYTREVLNIPNPKVVDALGLERRKSRRYSYREVTTGIATHYKTWKDLFTKAPQDLALAQKQLLELYNKVQAFADISRSFSLVFPDFEIPEGLLAQSLNIDPGTSLSYLQLRQHHEKINALSKNLLEKKNAQGLGTEDEKTTKILRGIIQISRDQNSRILQIIPPQWGNGRDDQQELWYAPWNITAQGQGSPASAAFLSRWQELIAAYRAGDIQTWQRLTQEIHSASLNMANTQASPTMLRTELYFNNWKPFHISLGFYLAGLLCTAAGLMAWPKGLQRLAFALVLAGLAVHATGIGTRMMIMERPPVTNLYESIIFVSLIAVAFGLILERRLKNFLGLIVAATIGTLLHFLGLKFDADGDTMGMLVAVLDTNFWLATHVVTITIGYGCCLVAGVLGHVYLIRRLIRPQDKDTLTHLYKNMLGATLVALFFTTLGTILGGIWADQSWGRFWGWDPKENGALLITLWLIWLLHGKISGKVRELGYALGMVCTNIIVAMAWFGVNILSVGLHSYGFTQNASLLFFVFCAGELLLGLGFYMTIKHRSTKAVTV